MEEHSGTSTVAVENAAGHVTQHRRYRIGFWVELVLLILAVTFGAYVYVTQRNAIVDLQNNKSALQNQVTDLQSRINILSSKAKAVDKNATTTTSFNIVSGPVTSQSSGTVTVTALYKPATISELWVDYGMAPDALTESSAHVLQGLSAAAPNNAAYGSRSFQLPGLTPGNTYFYRVIAIDTNGQTIQGGVTNFTAQK